MKQPGYIEALLLFVAERRLTPYAWGTNDCVIYAADAAVVVTGVDPLGDLRGTWATEAEAMAVLAAEGGLVAAMDARFSRVRRNFEQRGDLALVRDADGQPSLAVCMGAYASAPGETEGLLVPANQIRLAWET